MMTTRKDTTDADSYPQAALQCLIQGDYETAAQLYQQAIAADTSIKQHYWYLGLTLLLQGQEAEAQTTWMLAMLEGSSEQVEQWTGELIEVLCLEAERRHRDFPVAWTIRQHIREINPDNINNLLQIVQLSIQMKKFAGEDLISLGIIPMLQSESGVEVEPNLLLQVLQNALDYPPISPPLLEFAAACLPYAPQPQTFIHILMLAAIKIAYARNQPEPAIYLAKLCLGLDPENLEILSHLATFYSSNEQYDESIETAKLCRERARKLPDRIFANCLLLRSFMNAGGRWKEALELFKDCESLLLSLIDAPPIIIEKNQLSRLLNSTFFLPYLRDDAKANRSIQNQVLQICQAGIEHYAKEAVERYRQRQGLESSSPARAIKIGYLSHCLGRHSVGWLVRWIFEHHDRHQFQINGYLVNYESKSNHFLQEWFVERVDQARQLGTDPLEIADRIYRDEIDILIDLDSITLDITCEVMALKPAPVQVTWLGWDASGIPAIDYFIADPYVVPEAAQDYYRETIWRLPQTYIAVDGFEVGVPTLRRDALDIPSDAVVYLSAQKGYKRHPATIGLQMRIIKEVPNSYFLIKGFADRESVKSFFIQMAEAEGVDPSRLRFLPAVDLESVHRANLAIADVVLDTYPYNGATTTMETLWMCVPLVTRVGQQFSARNSYTMMVNAGITEGIAWTDEEYVEWGIRLGKDPVLRQQISWRLRQSRQTAPLWNAQQFTRELEKAYQQMWQRYLETSL